MIEFINEEEMKKECQRLLGRRGLAAYKIRKWCEWKGLVNISPDGEYIKNVSSVQVCAAYCLLNGYIPTLFPLQDIESDINVDIYNDVDQIFPKFAIPLTMLDTCIKYYCTRTDKEKCKAVYPYIHLDNINRENKEKEKKKGRGLLSFFTKKEEDMRGYAELYEQILVRLNSRRVICDALKLTYQHKQDENNNVKIKLSKERRRRK